MAARNLLSYFSLLLLCLVPRAFGNTDEAVVFVHGLAAFADTFQYRSEFEDAGFQTFAVNVGKFTSNWHRACETYAQLKGTRVDYGVCHAREFGHLRYGIDYTGQAMYPEWDENHKVHLLGHSMGGQTIRTLERLLREGSGCPEDTSPLFQGGKNWITSLTTLSAPLDGTTLIGILDAFQVLDLLKNLIVAIAGLIDNTLLDSLFTIDFIQWGLERERGESFNSFWNRVVESGFLSEDNKDISVYDLSIDGAREFNSKGPMAYSDTYYFSFATERTHPDQDCILFIFCGQWEEDPDFGMSLFLKPTGNLIGQKGPQEVRKNDGLVNWLHMLCPTVDGAERSSCVEYDGTWNVGTWTYFDVDFLDHVQISVRNEANAEAASQLYRDHAARLSALP